MKKRLFILSASIAVLFAILIDASAQQKLWVTATNATLKSAAKSSSGTVANLKVGTELILMTQNGKWYQVKADGKTGWIYRGKVSNSPPVKETAEDDSLLGGMLDSNVRADAADTSRSIRGLSPEATAYADSTGTSPAYRKALDKVLAMKVREAEIANLLKNGKIGEYAQ